MAMEPAVRKKLNDHEARLLLIEERLGLDASFEKASAEEPVASKESTRAQKQTPSPFANITFTQVITFLGIIGIIIGALSFFFYAVANRWIGETAQVFIGIIGGFLLFMAAYFLREKRESWSNIVFGGAYIIEYIAIAVGVMSYKVMPSSIGVFLGLIVFVSAMLLAMKFDSRMIGYFGVVGGYLLPFITSTFDSSAFTLTWYVVLSLGLIAVSVKKEWADLRIVSFFIVTLFTIIYLNLYYVKDSISTQIAFLIAMFVLYHVAGIMNSLRKVSAEISGLDAATLVVSPILFFSFLYGLLDWPLTQYGLLILLYALAQIAEIYLLKGNGLSSSAIITLLATGFVSMNMGILFFIHETQVVYWIVIFAVQQALFSYLGGQKKTESPLYRFFSYLFLALTLIWLVVIWFDDWNPQTDLASATALLLIALGTTASFIAQTRKQVDFMANAGSFILSGFITLAILAKYIGLYIPSNQTVQIILSVLWLAYTVILFKQVETTQGKTLVGILLGFTLLKIAFSDLFYLSGAYRIIGFILFGVLLLIGGYVIRK